MAEAKKIVKIDPLYAIPGGEIIVECSGVVRQSYDDIGLSIGGINAAIVGATNKTIVAKVPDVSGEVKVFFLNEGEFSNEAVLTVGTEAASGIHMVCNPAIDPHDDSVILTRSGSRGQELPVTMLRMEADGYLSEMSVEIKNPSGLAFDRRGKLFVSNRADGEVYQINHDDEFIPVASDLGVASGLAFDSDNTLYVGDRSGSVFKIDVGLLGTTETWAIMEPSVSAYHLAFSADGDLYVTAPGLCSFDNVYRIDKNGVDEIFFRGLGRPQGLAFDRNGNLYVAGCLKGRHGIVRITGDGKEAEIFLAGEEIVGLCFDRKGNLLAATGEKLYSIATDIYGILLD